nr:zinc finger, CCHC-type [Tanacetum cinerariifolium]
MLELGGSQDATPNTIIQHKKDDNVTLSEVQTHLKVTGCLMYAMISTRPDIAFAVGKLRGAICWDSKKQTCITGSTIESEFVAFAAPRYTSNLSAQHWQALARVFQYLKGTMNYGLTYSSYPSIIEGYSDASWINNTEDHSSTSGWVFLLGGGAICWDSKKQTCITGSTIESEFVAFAAPGNEAEWLRNLVYEIPLWPKPVSTISIRCDNDATWLTFILKCIMGSLDT